MNITLPKQMDKIW